MKDKILFVVTILLIRYQKAESQRKEIRVCALIIDVNSQRYNRAAY